MRGVWPVDNSENDPPEYSQEEEKAALKAAEERLMRKKAAGLLRPQVRQSVQQATTAPIQETKKRKVRVIRDESGAITGYEAE